LFSFSGCEKDDNETKGPKVETLSAEKGRLYVALLTGRVSGLDGVPLDFECGIEYSTDASFPEDKTTRQKVEKKYSEDPFSVTITNVIPGQKYYYRAYYIGQLMIYYGVVKDFTFTTWDVAQNGSENGYQYVDLGLSVRWATFNVGANKPEEYGDYFAWGETEPYYEAGYAQESSQAHWKDGKTSGYTWTNYKFRTSGDYDNVKFSKYNTSSSYGPIDNNTTLDPEDDVAHVQWGGTWRMPTKADWDNLQNKCTWTWYGSGNTEFNGVAGYKVTSKIEGYADRFIFLPAAGYRDGTNLNGVGSYGYYWSSSLITDGPNLAWYIYFYSSLVYAYYNYRVLGQSVRPVCP